MSIPGRRPAWMYVMAVAALCACLWIGWADFTPSMSQAEVQQAIRAAPRRIVQILMQFIAPALLLAFRAREIVAFTRTRRPR